MKALYKTFSLVFVFTVFSFQSKAQSFHYALKFNYGVFNYNNQTSQFIKQPFDAPFSLGFQFQSNFSKAFTNSVGFNTYKWADNSSYSIQDVLFVRNNARLLNRLKPQIGFGLGFEESKATVLNNTFYKQYAFIPIILGLQTDLTERISLGIFGELKYGFDIKDFDIKKGAILPNNTAGVSIAYRFSKVKGRSVYPEVSWSNSESLITVKSLKDYQNKKTPTEGRLVESIDVNRTEKTPRLTADSARMLTKMQALTPLLVADSLLEADSLSKTKSSLVMVQGKQANIQRDTIYLQRDSFVMFNPSLYNQMLARNTSLQDSLNQQKANDFRLSDFTDATTPDTVFLVNNRGLQNDLPTSLSSYPTTPVQQPYNYNTPQNIGYPNYAASTSDYTQTAVPLQTGNTTNAENLTTGLQIAETGSSALLNVQLGKLISLQTQTLALLSQSKIKSDSSALMINKKPIIDSLMHRISNLESRLNKIQNTDSLGNAQSVSEVDTKPVLSGFCVISYPINQTELTDLQRNIIINNVFKNYLKNENYKISLESYTDNSGPSAYNKKLSDMRLKRAVQFLLVLGVKPQDLITKSYGDSKASEEINPEERRLVIKVIASTK